MSRSHQLLLFNKQAIMYAWHIEILIRSAQGLIIELSHMQLMQSLLIRERERREGKRRERERERENLYGRASFRKICGDLIYRMWWWLLSQLPCLLSPLWTLDLSQSRQWWLWPLCWQWFALFRVAGQLLSAWPLLSLLLWWWVLCWLSIGYNYVADRGWSRNFCKWGWLFALYYLLHGGLQAIMQIIMIVLGTSEGR